MDDGRIEQHSGNGKLAAPSAVVMPTPASLSIQFSVQWAHALCSARASSDLAFVGEWLARRCKANLRGELRSSRGRQCSVYRWTAAGRPLQDYSRDCRLAGGNRIGSDTARPSLLDWTVGSGHLDGWRPVLELFEAPAPPRAQQQGNWTRSASGIAFSPARLPTPAVLNCNRYRSGLRSLFCGRNTTLSSLFLAAIARPPLLMTRLPWHAAGGAK